MKTKKLIIILLCANMFFSLSCSKEGPQGPAGPQGEQGEQGTPGSKGDKGNKGDKGDTGSKGDRGDKGSKGDKGNKGDKGDKGTANVIYSDWIGVTYTTSGSNYYASFKIPELTQEIFDKGELVIYYRYASSYLFKLNFSGDEGYVLYRAVVGGVSIYASGFWGASPAYFRYVIIPGGVHARQGTPAPDLNDYHAVCRYYGITEQKTVNP